jgi:hypothetical protein
MSRYQQQAHAEYRADNARDRAAHAMQRAIDPKNTPAQTETALREVTDARRAAEGFEAAAQQ